MAELDHNFDNAAPIDGDFCDAVTIEKLWVKPSQTTLFEPDEWADPSAPKDCYTYGINIPEVGEGAVGHIGSIDFGGSDISSPEAVKKLILQDELEELETLPEGDSHVIAVFWTPTAKGHGRPDFHVYRRDSYGEGGGGDPLWSHLYIEGSGCGASAKPSEYDHSGDLIFDPLECDHGRDNYEFVGYFAFKDVVTAEDNPGLQIIPKVKIDPNSNQHTFTSHNNPTNIPGKCMTMGEKQRGFRF